MSVSSETAESRLKENIETSAASRSLGSHQRTKSAALSLLRRNPSSVDEDSTSDRASAGRNSFSSPRSPPTTALSYSAMSTAHKHPAGHSHQLSRSSTSIAGLPAQSSQTLPSKSSNMPAYQDKPLSIEQSVRKFRVFEALRNGDTATISRAIRENAEGSTSGLLEDTTILHLAIQCAELPVVEYVLSDGAASLDVNARDRDGNTPLHVAAAQGRGQVVHLLLQQRGINDSIANYQGRLPLDLARTPDIFQQLQLSRSLYLEAKISEIQSLIANNEYEALGDLLEEPRFKTVLDINGPEFATDITTVQAGGTLLHEAARKKNTALIEVLLLHGADPFRRDRRGKLPQDVTKDEATKAMLKKSPAAVAAQRGIQEKAVLGNATSQTASNSAPGDAVAGKEAREMKGYLKKWTNYRKGYQLRWFVLEDGVLSYYKHQDDMGSSCRGAINMKIAQLHMDPLEKTKFEIIGKSSVKYSLKANHEVEAKRWFWALNNSIQWTKDQAKEEDKQRSKSQELLRQAKEQTAKDIPRDPPMTELTPESVASPETTRRNSQQSTRLNTQVSLTKTISNRVAFQDLSAGGSIGDEEDGTAFGSYEPSFAGDPIRVFSNVGPNMDGDDDEDDFGQEGSSRGPPVTKDAFDITAQSAKLQLNMMNQVQEALKSEQARNPTLVISDSMIVQALSTYEGSIHSLEGLLGDLLKISKDRDSFWQQRLDREIEMRRMWEDSMAQVAREHEELQARVGEAEEKRKRTKKALREVIESASRPDSRDELESGEFVEALESVPLDADGTAIRRRSIGSSLRRRSMLADMTNLSESESEIDEEFFDAVDAGEVEVTPMPPAYPQTQVVTAVKEKKFLKIAYAGGVDLSLSYHGYENGIRKRLKIDADNRPKISLWSILKSMIGKDMTKMTLPVTFNEPTSLLYRCAEDMEYADLLDTAACRLDSTERLLYVATFAASEYASTIGRVAKPFNPLLGETFEYVRPDKEYRFFIEQVSHHPPVGAAWAESPRWTYYGESAVKSKFYGKSFDINPLGTWFLKLRPDNGDKEELYTWKKVTSSVVGIITGNPTVDNYGTMEIKNWTTGEVATVEFKPRGWSNSSAYQISGRVSDSKGNPRFSMGGRWNNRIYARLTPGYEAQIQIEEPKDGTRPRRGSISDPNQAFLVWEANERPTGIPFNLTPFVLTFNDLNDQLRPWLAPTDSRFRPDQRAMEDGEYDFAANEKNRVEEKQRKKRREREAKGEEFVPHWFIKTKCDITGEEYWQFNGRYWAERENAGHGDPSAWKDCEDIF